jgi:non-ribosomal peptide synthetase component F
MIEHGALLDHCFGVIKSADLSTCNSFALFAPLVFDAGHSIIHSAFILGACIHVMSKQLLNDGEKLAAYIHDNSIDCVKIVPSLWLSYADSGNAGTGKKTDDIRRRFLFC